MSTNETPQQHRVMRKDKTKQDKMPVNERPRVREWQQRLDKMRNSK